MKGQLERGGYVIIANHVSYVDGIVLGSIFPIVFVSKKEVPQLAHRRPVEHSLRHDLHRPPA
jgi:hypothetical protein